jgi:hypothetical protein
VEAPRDKQGFLDSPLRELGAYWLELRCDPDRCTKIAIVPLRMLAVQRGAERGLQDVLARMRCSSCGERPALARITDSPIKVAPHETGQGAKWSVTLLP